MSYGSQRARPASEMSTRSPSSDRPSSRAPVRSNADVAASIGTSGDACPATVDNGAYAEETFARITELAPRILADAARFGVPPVAIAGAIADELDTRQGIKGIIDWFQDEVLINNLPSSWMDFDDEVGFDSKLLNANKHDLGIGNIKLETAMAIQDEQPEAFDGQSYDRAGMVDYLRTDEGTVRVAAAVIAKGKALLDPYVGELTEAEREAVYVTYYKQGDSYLRRFEIAAESNPDHQIKPGEGCGVLRQRERFLEALYGAE